MSLKEDVTEARERWQFAAKEVREARENIERINKDLKEVDRDLKETKAGTDRRAKLKRREERLEDRKKQEQREKKNYAEMKKRRDNVKDELVKKLKDRQVKATQKPSGNWTAPGPDTWGGCREVIDNEVIPVLNKYGVPITSRKRTETYGNPTSDHHVSQTSADAVDAGTASNWALQDRVGESVGVGSMSDYVNEYFTYEGVRFRIQTIAGTHGTGPHLHTGIRRA